MSRRTKRQVAMDSSLGYELRLQGYTFEQIRTVLLAQYAGTAINFETPDIHKQVTRYEKKILNRPLGTINEEINSMISYYQMLIKEAFKETKNISEKGGTATTRVISNIIVEEGRKMAVPAKQIDDINKSPNEKIRWFAFIKSCVDKICELKGLTSSAAQVTINQQFNQKDNEGDGNGGETGVSSFNVIMLPNKQ